MLKLKLFFIAGFFAPWLTFSQVSPRVFHLTDLSLRNLLQATSKASLETVSVQIPVFEGEVFLDKTFKLEGLIDTRSISSSSKIRDQIVLHQILEVARFPEIKVVATGNLPASFNFDSSEPVEVPVQIAVDYRAKKQTFKAPFRIQYFKENESTQHRLPGNLMKLSADFEVDLSSFGVQIPEKWKSLFHPQVQVAFDAVASEKIPNSKILLPDGPKPKERG